MKFGAYIPLSGHPFLNDPLTFPKMEAWQQAAALEVVYKFIQEGKVLGPFPGTTRNCPITGMPLFFLSLFRSSKNETRDLSLNTQRIL